MPSTPAVWANNVTVGVLLRENKPDEALRVARLVSGASAILASQMRLVEAFIRKGTESEIQSAESVLTEHCVWIRDCEPHYWIGASMAYCQRREAALRQLNRAVESGFAAYQAMDRDPLLASIRSDPEFARIRASAVERQNRFLAHRSQTPKRS